MEASPATPIPNNQFVTFLPLSPLWLLFPPQGLPKSQRIIAEALARHADLLESTSPPHLCQWYPA